MIHSEYKIILNTRSTAEKTLNELNKKYDTTICGITMSNNNNNIVIVVGMTPKFDGTGGEFISNDIDFPKGTDFK